jgi:plasmid maintenance system killer protein
LRRVARPCAADRAWGSSFSPIIWPDSALLADIAVQPNNRLAALRGDRSGQHSIRTNQQWRICFVWKAGGPDMSKLRLQHRS